MDIHSYSLVEARVCHSLRSTLNMADHLAQEHASTNRSAIASRSEPPLLAGVAYICRARPQVGAISEIARLIDAFADPTSWWSLVKACERSSLGLIRLLPRTAARETIDMEPLLRHQIFNRALVQAVRHGDLLVVQWFVEEYLPTGKIREPAREAAECGQLAILQWLFANHAARMVRSVEELGRAAMRDHFTTVQWLYEIQLHIGVLDDGDSGLFEVLCHTARNGNLEMVQWADQRREQDWVVTDAEPVMCTAARSGHLAVLEYFSAHCSAACARACLQNALWGCQLELAQ